MAILAQASILPGILTRSPSGFLSMARASVGAMSRPDSLRALASSIGRSLRHARHRGIDANDEARFLSPLIDVLHDLNGTLSSYAHQGVAGGPPHVRAAAGILQRLASRPAVPSGGWTKDAVVDPFWESDPWRQAAPYSQPAASLDEHTEMSSAPPVLEDLCIAPSEKRDFVTETDCAIADEVYRCGSDITPGLDTAGAAPVRWEGTNHNQVLLSQIETKVDTLIRGLLLGAFAIADTKVDGARVATACDKSDINVELASSDGGEHDALVLAYLADLSSRCAANAEQRSRHAQQLQRMHSTQQLRQLLLMQQQQQ